jgi:myo-inositol-1(or 4)-monophosphatase
MLKSAIINVMEAAARKASRGLIRDFGEVEQLQVARKGPADFVSAADLRVERVLVEELRKGRPRFGMLMEESGAAGLIYQPLSDELFWAEKNMGAYLNRRRLRVTTRQHLSQALVATGLPFKGKPKHPKYVRTLEAVLPEVAGVRRFGSAALDLAWVAAGRYDGFWEFALAPWDIAAGILLVSEAGGSVSDLSGGAAMLDSGDVLAGNPPIHQALGKLVQDALKV